MAAVALVFTIALVGGGVASADWPSYRGGPTQNMSRAENPGLHPQQVWESVESMRNEPCVIASGESAFTIATPKADFGAQRLFRIDLTSGKTVWSTPTFEVTEQASCPAADSSHVFYAHGKFLTAVDITSGEQMWEANLGGEVDKPVTSEGRVYVNASGTLFALDATDGSVLWSAPAQFSGRPPLVVSGVVVNVGIETSLSAFDASTGAALWSTGGQIFDAIGLGDSIIYSLEGKSVISRDAVSGAVSWSYGVPILTSARKLVAESPLVYALTPSTDFRFQVNHLIALGEETGTPKYVREFQEVESCCGTTAAYPPFVKFGPTLYNQYRYFDAATGAAPGGELDRTHTVFYDGTGCANEQDSMFAHVGSMIVAWKNLCSRSVLVARQAESEPEPEPEPEGPGPIKLIQPGPEAFTGTRPQFGWNVGSPSSVSHYELVIDKATFAKVPAGEEFEAVYFTPGEDLAEGPHTWSIVVVDKSGNRTESETRSFTVDAVGPQGIELIEPAPSALTGPRPQFTWSAAVDFETYTDHYELLIDKAIFAKVPAEEGAEIVSFTPSEDLIGGSHTWSVIAVDAVGNSKESETRSFTVDANPPETFSLIAPTNGEVTGPHPEFSWQAAPDPEGSGLDHYELTIDGEVSAFLPPGTESFTPGFDLAEGVHKWWVTAVDAAGNRIQTEPGFFIIDASAPGSVELVEPGPESVTSARPQFRWWTTFDSGKAGLDHYELVVDEAMLAEIPASPETEILAFTPSEDLATGFHIWSVTAVDGVGNRSESETRTFTVDADPPQAFGLLTPADGAVSGSRPQFSWQPALDEGKAGLDRYELILDGEVLAETFIEKEFFTPSFDLAAGPHTWSVTAFDKAGNSRSSETRTFTVDVAPPTPFALTAPADEAITEARPQFAWEAASDLGGAGLNRYELTVDEKVRAEVPAGTESFTPSSDLAPGLHVWSVIAVDNVGNQRSSGPRSFIVASPPVAALAESSVLALTGNPVTFDASPSKPPAAGTITRYEWDLDGDGVYERDTGESPTTEQTYTEVKDLTISVRVSSNLGTDATASAQVSVRLAPPPGPLGVTINEGAQFTNDPNVTVSPVWPTFALTALVSNDGGFRAAGTFPVAAAIPWTLESSGVGAERLPKTIYVRFQGGEAGRETYQDDIILDQKKPKVGAASVSGGGGALAIRARDDVSGVASMQILSDRAAGPRSWTPFRRRIRLATRRGRVFVRVRDRAGNVSAWRRAVFR